MLEIKNQFECCGCGVCAVKCPKKCIEMTSDPEGFLYPSIKSEQCINCGLCNKVCPVINPPADNSSEVKTESYAAYATDSEVRKVSSLGGIFTILSTAILEKGGKIYGAAFDNDFSVHHIGIAESKDMYLLQGSKYTQSRMENIFVEVKKTLDSGRYVLFSGVACQTAALKHYLGKDYDKLFTVDVLCHGVPSPAVWKRYLEEKENQYGSQIKNIYFRNKSRGWKLFSMKIEFENDDVYIKTLHDDEFMKLFLRNICLRPSCHNCKFKSMDRMSDVTIGDAWGVDKHSPEMDDDKGTSVVIIHSNKGLSLLNEISDKIILKKCDTDIILPPSADSRKSVLPHKNREKFFRHFAKGRSIEKLVAYLKPSVLTRIKYKLKQILKNKSAN